MEINNNTVINVCNYMPYTVIVTSNVQSYVFSACDDDDSPTIIPMTMIEIRNINSSSDKFKIGELTFEEDMKEEIYNALRINNWRDILSQRDIMDIILSGSKDGLQKFIDITSVVYFERVRGVYIALKQAGTYDIPTRSAKVIEKRYDEINNNIFKSQIELKDTLFNEAKSSDKIIEEKDAQIAKQGEQIKEMMAMLEKLMSNPENKSDVQTESTEKIKSTKVANKGRPKSKK